jgi:hypothetical protein
MYYSIYLLAARTAFVHLFDSPESLLLSSFQIIVVEYFSASFIGHLFVLRQPLGALYSLPCFCAAQLLG